MNNTTITKQELLNLYPHHLENKNLDIGPGWLFLLKQFFDKAEELNISLLFLGVTIKDNKLVIHSQVEEDPDWLSLVLLKFKVDIINHSSLVDPETGLLLVQ